MKKTLYLSILAATLMGGQVFAAEVIPTKLDGATDTGANSYSGQKVTGTGEEAKETNVTIYADNAGNDCASITVYGGWSTKGAANNNTVTMTGGLVKSVYGGKAQNDATGNTVTISNGQVKYTVYGGSGGTDISKNSLIMTGGTVQNSVYGGHSTETGAVVKENTVIVAGNSELSSNLYCGYSSHGDAKDNKVYLVGKGATATIADAKGITSTYTGGNIKLKTVYAGYGDGTLDNNSIDIYGTGITASGYVAKMQILNFHISQNQIGGEYANASMLTLTTYGMDLTNVTIGIQDVDVQAWTPGTMVTLVQLEQDKRTITGIESGKEVDIMRGNQVVAKGQLVLSNDDKTLSLSIPGSVPEPTTGTLGLLALAGLCIRRRK